MKAPPRTLLLVLWCALTLCVQAAPPPTTHAAADYVVREWHEEDGLPHEDVLQLHQDRAGYLWVACRGSLSRFDGQRFFPEEAAAARDSFHAMAASKGDGILLAPREGDPILYQDGHYTRTTLPTALAGHPVGGFFDAPDGARWYSLRGAALRIKGDEIRSYDAKDGLGEGAWTRFASDTKGRVWMSGKNFLARLEGDQLRPVKLDGDMGEVRIVQSRDAGPWLVTADRVYKFDTEDRPHEVVALPTLLGAHYVNTALEDRRGALWLGTRSAGLHKITPGASILVPTSSDTLTTLIEDREGTLWAGTIAGGLCAISRRNYTLYSKAAGLAAAGANSVCADAKGDIWVANGDGGIARIRDSGIERWTLRQGGQVYSAGLVSRHPVRGIWAVGGTGAAVFHLAGDDTGPAWQDQIPGGAIRTAMYTAFNGELWMTTADRKVGRLQGTTRELYGTQEGVSVGGVRCFGEGPSNEVLAGTNEGALLRFDGSRFVKLAWVPALDGAINTLMPLGESLWVGTAANGILIRHAGKTTRLTRANGLPDDNITQLMADTLGHVWCGSSRGVFRLRLSEIEKLGKGELGRVHALRLGPDEGLGTLNCQGNYGPSAARSADGRLWFATKQGVLAIDPWAEIQTQAAPRAKIEQILEDDRARPRPPLWTVGNATQKLELRFSSLCLATPSRVETHHRLVGFDSTWVRSAAGSASYPRLAPGRYRFEVGARFEGGGKPEPSDTLEIVIHPLWWQTAWFQVAVATLLVGIIIIAVRHLANRRLRRRVRRLEGETAEARVRERIARDIHDEVGASLTRISLLSQTKQPDAPGAENLRRIDETARELTLALDEIVWAVNPQHDTLESFASYLSDFTLKLLSAAGLRCRLQIPSTLPALTLASEVRHDLFLCCREVLNNVVRHAGASEVCIHVSVTGTLLGITITDNGCGLGGQASRPAPGDRISHGNGLPNLRTRMERLGGSCTVESPLAGGTMVRLSVALPATPTPLARPSSPTP